MKQLLASVFVLSCLIAPAFADGLADYKDTIDQISSWSSEKGAIKYKGTNKTLKAYANAHDTAITKVEKEKAKIKQAESDYYQATRLVDDSKRVFEINKPMWGAGRGAVEAKERIKRDDIIKRAERGINSANRQKIESQKLALQELRRKLKQEKFSEDADKEEQKTLIDKITELIDDLSSGGNQ